MEPLTAAVEPPELLKALPAGPFLHDAYHEDFNSCSRRATETVEVTGYMFDDKGERPVATSDSDTADSFC